jgi:hypothetical protein
MQVTATKFRQNLYSILDQVLETGIPVQIERKGQLLVVEPKEAASLWDRLEAHDIVQGDPDDIIHMDWSGEWKGGAAP